MIYVIAGVLIVFFVLRDVFQTVMVPRGKVAIRIAPFIVRRLLWPLIRHTFSKVKSPVWRSEFLGLFGPFFVIILLLLWMCLLITGLGLITFALGSHYSPAVDSLPTAIYASGASVLTLGAGEFVAKSNDVRFLMMAGALCGMLIMALVVSLVFTLIGSIQRREVLVAITSNLGGSPPCGLVILETHGNLNGRENLKSFFDDWHIWCADVLESHREYPILPYFRSSGVFTSWLTALGAALDAATLVIGTGDERDAFSAKLLYKSASQLIREVAGYWGLNIDTSDGISAEDFHQAYSRLEQAGYHLLAEEEAIKAVKQLRAAYFSAHKILCNYLLVPEMPFLSDHQFSLLNSEL